MLVSQASQLVLSSSFYTLILFFPFQCCPRSFSQLILILLVYCFQLCLLTLCSLPALAQFSWIELFVFILFSFFCLQGALCLPSCSFCSAITAALRSWHSCVTGTWLLETFLWHKGTWVRFCLCPCTDCSHALCVPVARYCVRVYKEARLLDFCSLKSKEPKSPLEGK